MIYNTKEDANVDRTITISSLQQVLIIENAKLNTQPETQPDKRK